MRLYDYKYSPVCDRRKWMETFKIASGLGYFVGKQFIGKYLMNRLLNMAVRMEGNGEKADIFVDVFTGGGKIGLSVPEGWFDTVVINDLDYGVASYFKSCKDNPKSLIELIEELGGCMSEELFKFFAYNRCNSSVSAIKDMKTEYGNVEWIADEVIEPLLAGAMTFWVVQSEFNGCTSPDKVSYSLNGQDKIEQNKKNTHEKEAIRNIIELAKRRIPKVHEIMKSRNVIIESLDYRELIKKYNGKTYQVKNEQGEYETKTDNTEMAEKNKLWYFDPPYHPATLSGGKEAPYMNTFPLNMAHEMTRILHNEGGQEFGEIKYFIKSDYNPKDTYESFYDGLGEAIADKDTERVSRLRTQLDASKKAYHDFDVLEENDMHSTQYKDKDIDYYVECIGDFGKGAIDGSGEKTLGREYIWCRGNYQGEKSSDWKYDGKEQPPQ